VKEEPTQASYSGDDDRDGLVRQADDAGADDISEGRVPHRRGRRVDGILNKLLAGAHRAVRILDQALEAAGRAEHMTGEPFEAAHRGERTVGDLLHGREREFDGLEVLLLDA
jgi:hypothetical protein